MRINIRITLVGFALLVGGCSGSVDSPPIVGGSSGLASADDFTNSIAQTANGLSDTEEPSDQLAELTPSTPEDAEPANL